MNSATTNHWTATFNDHLSFFQKQSAAFVAQRSLPLSSVEASNEPPKLSSSEHSVRWASASELIVWLLLCQYLVRGKLP